MNALNYKVLLVKLVFYLFLRAVGIYLLITLPALLVLPEMYILSALYALGFGWIAGLVFLLFFCLVQRIRIQTAAKKTLLYVAVVAGVALAFQLMEVTGVQQRIWQSGICLLFPAIAVISGWISIAVSMRAINVLFEPPGMDLYDSMLTTSSAQESGI